MVIRGNRTTDLLLHVHSVQTLRSAMESYVYKRPLPVKVKVCSNFAPVCEHRQDAFLMDCFCCAACRNYICTNKLYKPCISTSELYGKLMILCLRCIEYN